MSKCLYKEIAININKSELEEFYSNNLPRDVMKKFDIPTPYLLKQVLKYFGITPHTPAENTRIQFENMSDSDRIERGRKISKSNIGREFPQDVRDKISSSQKGVPKKFSKPNPTTFKRGNLPWNKGKVGVQRWVVGQAEKRYNTMKENNSFNKSSDEEKLYENLCNQYGSDDVKRQYKDSRYPFSCDFYIVSEDLFIELNAHWTHGPHPFNKDNPDDIKLLEFWKSKSDGKNMYSNAIDVWTRRDVIKRRTALENGINYIAIY